MKPPGISVLKGGTPTDAAEQMKVAFPTAAKLHEQLLAGDHVVSLDTLLIDAGVVWTLRFEWMFYLVLPFLRWFTRGPRFLLLLGAALIVSTVGARAAAKPALS